MQINKMVPGTIFFGDITSVKGYLVPIFGNQSAC